MTQSIIATIAQLVLGYIFIEYVPGWLHLKSFFTTISRIIGVVIIISAILHWILFHSALDLTPI